MNKYLKEILEKMFSYVGAEFSEEEVKEKDFFLKRTWSESQQADFRYWLYQYLKSNKKAQKELYGYHSNNKIIRSRAEFFCLNHGWKVK